MHASLLLLAAALPLAHGLGQLEEYNRKDVWVKALLKCGKDGKEENMTAAVMCQEHMEREYASAAGQAGFTACDEQYCRCVGGVWSGTECATPQECREGCSCMEQCYAEQMECGFIHMVGLYQTHRAAENWCEVAGITECVRETRGKMVEECKRGLGVTPSQISWMREPTPEGCDLSLVCASSAQAVSMVLLAAAAVAAVLA